MVTALALAAVVAERRRMAEKLRARVRARLNASQLNLAKAQALAHLGSWDWEIDSDRLRWSDELCRIFGLQPSTAALDYATFLARVYPDDRGLVDAVIRRAQSTGAAFEFEHRILRPDGSMRWLHGCGDVRQRNGVAVAMSCSALDITDRRDQGGRRSKSAARCQSARAVGSDRICTKTWASS
jgi:PAS domain S-box-containing protein